MALTNKDIDKLLAVLATKQDVSEIREEMQEMKESLNRLIIAVDRLASTVDKLLLEYAAISSQLTRHEKWIRQIAKQAGVRLEE
ncbi:hypothetical protein HY478_02260 [Candidatus Uhrbacteria bacterium]|nr:hypothetical protein [Candidatus Uhrbacteria bacterium]